MPTPHGHRKGESAHFHILKFNHLSFPELILNIPPANFGRCEFIMSMWKNLPWIIIMFLWILGLQGLALLLILVVDPHLVAELDYQQVQLVELLPHP